MARINKPASYLITRGLATNDDSATREEVLGAIRLGIAHGVTLVQIREKHLSGQRLFDLVVAAAELTRNSDTKLLVNDRADIAWVAGADGVHLRSDSMSAAVVRKAFPDLLIGSSVHTLSEAEAAAAHADLVLFGPVFATPGKGQPVGIEQLGTICTALDGFPVIAIGGITADNAVGVLNAGAAGVAAIRAMNEPEPLAAIMDALRNA